MFSSIKVQLKQKSISSFYRLLWKLVLLQVGYYKLQSWRIGIITRTFKSKWISKSSWDPLLSGNDTRSDDDPSCKKHFYKAGIEPRIFSNYFELGNHSVNNGDFNEQSFIFQRQQISTKLYFNLFSSWKIWIIHRIDQAYQVSSRSWDWARLSQLSLLVCKTFDRGELKSDGSLIKKPEAAKASI